MHHCLRSIVALALLVLLGSLSAAAQRADDSGRASKNGKSTSTIDGVEVTVEFGRPSVNGRKIWGGLVPLGSVWRTGADEATTISFSKDVKIEGSSLPAGTYGLFTVPGEDEWTIVFNNVSQQWGAFSYNKSEDALRVDVKPNSADPEESLNFEFEGSHVVLRWEKLAVPFKIEAGG